MKRPIAPNLCDAKKTLPSFGISDDYPTKHRDDADTSL
jgi:hypothetical protein